jgi:transposase
VRAVIADGETVTQAAARFGLSRKTVHQWLARYEAGCLDGLSDRSHRPKSCPHEMAAGVEVALAESRVAYPSWGPRRLSYELGCRGVVVSESAKYRALARLNLVDPAGRRLRASPRATGEEPADLVEDAARHRYQYVVTGRRQH